MDHLRIEQSIEWLEEVRRLVQGLGQADDAVRGVIEFVRECAQIAQIHVDVAVSLTWTCGGCGKLQAARIDEAGQPSQGVLVCPDCGRRSGDYFVHYRKEG